MGTRHRGSRSERRGPQSSPRRAAVSPAVDPAVGLGGGAALYGDVLVATLTRLMPQQSRHVLVARVSAMPSGHLHLSVGAEDEETRAAQGEAKARGGMAAEEACTFVVAVVAWVNPPRPISARHAADAEVKARAAATARVLRVHRNEAHEAVRRRTLVVAWNITT